MAGHVHNAAYLHYFESARMHFLLTGLGKDWNWKKDGVILKKNTVEYIQPVYLTDELSIEVQASHIGSKSFTLHYSVLNQAGKEMAKGESVLVCFDYSVNQSVPIPDKVRLHLEKHLQG
jgi:acyl-CoA thioester hydrolase